MRCVVIVVLPLGKQLGRSVAENNIVLWRIRFWVGDVTTGCGVGGRGRASASASAPAPALGSPLLLLLLLQHPDANGRRKLRGGGDLRFGSCNVAGVPASVGTQVGRAATAVPPAETSFIELDPTV